MTTPPAPTSRPGLVLFALAFAGLSGSFMQTLLVPIQGQLPAIFDAPASTTAWAITITQLVSAICMPISGRLGDMYGKRRVALVLLSLLIIGSLLAANAVNIGMLIAARAIQGAGFGVIIVGISILRDVMPTQRLGTAVATVSATLGVGGAIGMPVSAYVATEYDWHALFWVASGTSALAFVLVLTLVPASTRRTGGRLDVPGIIGLSAALALIFLVISNGSAMTGPWIAGMLVLAAAILWVWGRWELRTENPLVSLRISARPAVLMTNITGVAMGFALFTPQIAFPQILSLPASFDGLGLPLVTASLIIMPMGLSMLAMSPIAGRLGQRWGARRLVVIGALVMAGGYAIALLVPPSVGSFLIVCVIVGSGTGLGYAAMPALIMSAVPVEETGAANGLNALSRSLGTALAAAVVATVIAGSMVTRDGVTAPTTDGFDLAFILAIIASVVCAGLAALIPNRGRLVP